MTVTGVETIPQYSKVLNYFILFLASELLWLIQRPSYLLST